MNPDQIEKLLEPYHSDNLETNRRVVLEFCEILGDMTHQLHLDKIVAESWEYYFETLIQKIIFHCQSVCELSEGRSLKSSRFGSVISILDYPSIFILSRAAIEAFLTLEYIYFSDVSEEERLFRFKLWQVSGILSRQGYNMSIDLGLEEKQKREKEIIDSLMTEIKKDPEYEKLNGWQKKNLEKFGVPRINSWNDLIKESKLKTEIFGNMYKLFSNYAHSEYLSVLQIRQSNLSMDNPNAINNVVTALNTIKQVLCLSIETLVHHYYSARSIFTDLSTAQQMAVTVWSNTAQGSGKMKDDKG